MARTKGSVFFTLVTLQDGEVITTEVRGTEALEAEIANLQGQGLTVTVIRGRIEGTFSGSVSTAAVGA